MIVLPRIGWLRELTEQAYIFPLRLPRQFEGMGVGALLKQKKELS